MTGSSGYTKFHKNLMLQFSPIFMTPGYTKIHKNLMLQFSPIWSIWFLRFSWPRVHETSEKSHASIFSDFHEPGYRKLHRNQMLQFSPTFMTPGTRKFISPIFMTPGTRNFTKVKCFNFLRFSWPRVHETSQKSNASFFSNFHETSQKSDPYFSPIRASALESYQFPLLLLLAFWVQPASRQPVHL